MNITGSHGLIVAVVIVLTTIAAGIISTYNSRNRIKASMEANLERLDKRADRMRPVKNSWLNPVVDGFVRIGMTPNRVTMLGAVLLGATAWAAARHQLGWALTLFVPGVMMDMLDGAIARRYPKLVHWAGEYLDPAVDTASGFTFAVILFPRYQHQLIPLILIGLLVARTIAFVWFRCEWGRKLDLKTLPKNWSGENKAAFIALGIFWMLIPNQQSAYVAGSEICLLLASLFEVQSLTVATVRFRRIRESGDDKS